MQDIYISIGQNIRRRRKEKHLTQESLAANVETSAQYISRIERGQVCPSLEFLYRLSCRTGMPYLFFTAIHCTQRFYQFLLSGACQSTQQLYSATATVFDELYFLVSPTVNSV